MFFLFATNDALQRKAVLRFVVGEIVVMSRAIFNVRNACEMLAKCVRIVCDARTDLESKEITTYIHARARTCLDLFEPCISRFRG